MEDFAAALGVALVLEGAAYALFPEAMKRALATVLAQPQGHLRTVGVAAAAVGVGVVWLVRG